MQSIFEYFVERFSQPLQNLLNQSIEEQDEVNPNDKLQKGVVLALEYVIKNKSKFGEKEIFDLASMSCYLTQKMKANEEFLKLLKEVKHPYIELFVAYFEENPTNYLESLNKIEKITKLLEEREDYSDEMRANVLEIHSWVYGQQSDVAKVKEILKYVRSRIKETDNLVEQFGLQESYMNCSWWFLHLGIEMDFDEIFTFVDPYVQKYKFYKTITSYLNVKGGIESFMGDNHEAIKSFEELIKVHEEYNDDYRLSIATGNLAEVHMVMGKSNLAKDMMEKAINLYKESTGKWPYLYLTELGNMYYLLGDDRAEESFLHAYEIQRKEKSLHKAFIMYELIHYYLRIENLVEAKKYLKELRSLSKELEAPSINARVDYLRGFLEMLNHNLSNASEYLISALEQAKHTRDVELILFCNIQLSVAYLWYYRLLENRESLNLAMSYIDTVSQLAVENNHNQILTSSLMICAVLCSVNGEYEKSLEDIRKARQVGKDIDFETLKRDLDKIEHSIQNARNTGLLEVAGQNIIEYILPQFKSLLSLKLVQTKRKDVEVLGLLIISESGIPIFSKLKDKLKTNDLLLSGLLMAITQFAESILVGKEIGRLKDVNYEDFCITLQAIKNGLVAV
ncbi:MAG: tetratricopeptide repeat protein, partial [Candidatus Heimdallarchaeaceae archaeon]